MPGASALLAGCSSGPLPAPSLPGLATPGPLAPPAGAFHATVVRVVDGDTFIARRAGTSATVRVRVIGIDSPETVKPDTTVACGGPAASALATRLLPRGATLRAAYERGGTTDRYGRQLWDVWLADGRFFAALMVRAGAARAFAVHPQTEHAGLLADLEVQARHAREGLWGPPCDGRSFPQ